MAPIALILASALLAIGRVDARKSQVSFSQWVSRDCSGHLAHGEKAVNLGTCHETNAQSIRLHVPKKRKYFDSWLSAVNSGQAECFVTAYSGVGCHDSEIAKQTFPVPASFEQCQSLASGIRSIKFHCENRGAAQSTNATYVSIYPVTSYDIVSSDRMPTATGYITSATVTGLLSMSTGYVTTVATVATLAIITPRAESPESSGSTLETLETRAAEAKHDFKNVWYLHPWGGNAICFQCWLRHKHNKDKFECESAESNTEVRCPLPAPDKNVVMFTSIVTPTPAIESMSIIPVVMPSPVTTFIPIAALEERREHKIVRITHPFLGVSTCAKAKWKHPGKHNQKVTLKGPHRCSKGNQNFNVDPQRPSMTLTFMLPQSTVTAANMQTEVTMIMTPIPEIPTVSTATTTATTTTTVVMPIFTTV